MTQPPSYPGAPRWVKVAGLAAALFVALFAIMHIAGGGFRHHGAPDESPATSVHDGHGAVP
jgi:hypothetical protein